MDISIKAETPIKVLNNQQREDFLRDGYLIVKDVYSVEDLKRGKEIIEQAFARKDWLKAPYSNETIINDIYKFYPELTDIIFNAKYAQAIRDIVGDEAGIVPECAIHHNRYFDWHKDTTSGEANGNFVHRKPGALFIVAGTYFQPNTTEGGGLTIVPGTQHTPDPFVRMYYGNFIQRIINKVQKITRTSVFHKIERSGNVIDVKHNLGDLLLFNLSLDHRATFIRNKRTGKPVEGQSDKYAVFNTFSPANNLAQEYIDYLKTRKEPYYHYLRSTSLPNIFLQKMEELNLTVYK